MTPATRKKFQHSCNRNFVSFHSAMLCDMFQPRLRHHSFQCFANTFLSMVQIFVQYRPNCHVQKDNLCHCQGKSKEDMNYPENWRLGWRTNKFSYIGF